MCRKGLDMMKVCGKMLSKVRREKNGVHQSTKGQFTIKYLIFREIWKIPCVVQIFRVVPKFPVFSLSGKSDNKIPCFPCAVATLLTLSSDEHLHRYWKVLTMFLLKRGANGSFSEPNWWHDCRTTESITYNPGTLYSGRHWKQKIVKSTFFSYSCYRNTLHFNIDNLMTNNHLRV